MGQEHSTRPSTTRHPRLELEHGSPKEEPNAQRNQQPNTTSRTNESSESNIAGNINATTNANATGLSSAYEQQESHRRPLTDSMPLTDARPLSLVRKRWSNTHPPIGFRRKVISPRPPPSFSLLLTLGPGRPRYFVMPPFFHSCRLESGFCVTSKHPLPAFEVFPFSLFVRSIRQPGLSILSPPFNPIFEQKNHQGIWLSLQAHFGGPDR